MANIEWAGSNADQFAATQVVLREREARDRCWWTVMGRCFHPESYIEISWFQGSGADFTAASEDMAARNVASRHRLGPPTVRVNEDRGIVLLPAVVETYPTIDDAECVLSAYCRLCYRVVKEHDEWLIAGLQVVYERDELRAAVPGESVAVPTSELSELRSPYRILAWSLGRAGFEISQDLPGDDQPESVELLYASAFRWAGMAWPIE